MNHNNFKRIKIRHMPGDFPLRLSINILEGNDNSLPRSAAKSFKKMIKMRERATLNRRALRDIIEYD